jgi:hypothetical protein
MICRSMTACYRPAVFFRHVVSLRFHPPKEKFEARLKNITFSFNLLKPQIVKPETTLRQGESEQNYI